MWIKLVKDEISLFHELIKSSFKKLETLPRVVVGTVLILTCPYTHGQSEKRLVFLSECSDILKGFLCYVLSCMSKIYSLYTAYFLFIQCYHSVMLV